MAKALTVLTVERAKSDPERRLEIPDGALPGLYLVVQPSGAKSWALRYRNAGKPRKLTLGAFPGIGLVAARDLATTAIRANAEGRDPGQEKREARQEAAAERDSFEAIAAQFIERYAKRQTRKSSWRKRLACSASRPEPGIAEGIGTNRSDGCRHRGRWKGRDITEITRRDVIELLDDTVDRGAATMANREFAAIRRMFNWCLERGIIDASPCAGVKAPASEHSRDRLLSDDEIKAVLEGRRSHRLAIRPAVQVALVDRSKAREVGEMRWREIDSDGRLWTLPRERVKNDRVHEVPLSDPALAILKALPRVSGRPGLCSPRTAKRQ